VQNIIRMLILFMKSKLRNLIQILLLLVLQMQI